MDGKERFVVMVLDGVSFWISCNLWNKADIARGMMPIYSIE